MRFITLKDNIITSTRIGKTIVEGEIQSDIGELGQQLVDGTFIDVEQPYVEPTPTIQDQINNLQDDIDYLILKQEGLIDETAFIG